MPKIECVVRGNGKGYALLRLDEPLGSEAQPALCVSVDGGDSTFGEVSRLDVQEGRTDRFVLVFPLLGKPIRLSFYANAKDATPLFEKGYKPFELKWESRLNYRLDAQTAYRIRDIEKGDYLVRRSLEIDSIIPDDESDVVRFTVTIPEAESADLGIELLDSSLNPTHSEFVALGSSTRPVAKSLPLLMTRHSLSVRIPKNDQSYVIRTQGQQQCESAFLCIDKRTRIDFIEDFRKRTRNAQEFGYYAEWLKDHELTAKERIIQERTVFENAPLISIVVPIFNTPKSLFCEMVESVLGQTYARWELLLVNASPENADLRTQAEAFSRADERIRLIELDENRGITLNTRAGIDAAQGDYVAFLDHDDLLAPNALFEYVMALNEDPSLDLLYCDEDKVRDGKRFDPYFKPDFSIFLLREVNYVCHFLMIRKTLLDQVEYSDPRFDGAQDHNLILQCAERTDRIKHIPRILYTWRVTEQSTAGGTGAKPYADTAGRLAVEGHLARCGIDAVVEGTEDNCRYHVRYTVKDDPLVSILIPSKDNAPILETCVRSLIDRTDYGDLEIIIIENNSEDERTFQTYEMLESLDPRIKVITWKDGFNYSAINNFGARHASGEYLLLLNNDTEAIDPSWLRTMVGICQQQGVGIVGAKLLYPDMLIQHAGVYVQGDGAGHLALDLPRHARGYFSTVRTTRELSAVTAACMLVDKAVFDEVGGLDEAYAVAFNDVDFCMKVRAAGKKVVYSSLSELIHYESISRGYENTPEKVLRAHREATLLRHKWSDQYVLGDPYMNKNLEPDSGHYQL